MQTHSEIPAHPSWSASLLFQAVHHRRNPLHHPERSRVADDAQRSPALENLIPLLPALGETRYLAAHPRCPEGQGTPGTRKKKAPTAAILDSQSVRTASQPGVRGYDAGKKITGRKRHALVDTNGFLLSLKVTGADVQDRDGARMLLEPLNSTYGWLKKIWADGGYSGKLVKETAQLDRHRQIDLEIVKRSDDMKGFEVLPKRWIVERTFGWLIQSRRLIRDHEVLISSSESLIYVSMAKRMLNRLAV